MRLRNVLLLLSAVVVLGGLPLVSSGREGESARPVSPVEWEYTSRMQNFSEPPEVILNPLAQEGWELVFVCQETRGTRARYILKRPKSPFGDPDTR